MSQNDQDLSAARRKAVPKVAATFLMAFMAGWGGTLALAPGQPVQAAPADHVRAQGTPTFHVSALGECTWVVVDSTPDANGKLLAECGPSTDVIAGGCMSSNASAFMMASGPYENGDANDQPDDNEAYTAITANSGWVCSFNAEDEMTAIALCCG